MFEIFSRSSRVWVVRRPTKIYELFTSFSGFYNYLYSKKLAVIIVLISCCWPRIIYITMFNIGDAHSCREFIYSISNIVFYDVLKWFEQFKIKRDLIFSLTPSLPVIFSKPPPHKMMTSFLNAPGSLSVHTGVSSQSSLD